MRTFGAPVGLVIVVFALGLSGLGPFPVGAQLQSGPALISSFPSGPASETTSNWAGYLYCPDGVTPDLCAEGPGTVDGVFGCWTVPAVAQTLPTGSSGGTQIATTWIGVGGTHGDHLAQIGVTETPGQAPSAWWETLPSPAQPISLEVNSGDEVCAQTEMVGLNPFGQQLWYFSLRDLTSGTEWDNGGMIQVCGGSLFWAACNSVDLNSADWILESPHLSGALTALPAFQETAFTNLMIVAEGTWLSVSSLASPETSLVLNLQSTFGPTAPAYMTWVSLRPSGAAPSAIDIEYLAGLTVPSQESHAGPTSRVELQALDRIVPDTNVAPFDLAWVYTPSPEGCSPPCTAENDVAALNFTVGTQTYSLPPTPSTGSGSWELCLWWAAPGSSDQGLAGGSLELECVGSPAATTVSAQPSVPHLFPTVVFVLVGLVGLVAIGILRSRWPRLRARPSRQSPLA